MSRYYTPLPVQPERVWWKSPAILGAVVLAVAVVGGSLAVEFTTQPVIHIRADDNSESAAGYTKERRAHCQAGTHNYKPGDTVLLIPFADRPVLSKDITVFNSLSLLGECQKTEREIHNKQPGTSLVLLLERINAAIQEQRDKKNFNPAVATILIDDAEPGPGQPALDYNRVGALVGEIGEKRGVVALMVPSGKLQEALESHLQGRASVCLLNPGQDESEVRQSVVPCVDSAFERARRLRGKE